MTTFALDQNEREALTPQRAKELLSNIPPDAQAVKLSGKSFGDGSALVAADALQTVIPTLKRLDISDIIASRPEEEAKRALATIADALASCKHLEYIDLSDNALGAKGIRAVGSLLAGQTELKELLLCNNGLAADAGELITSALLETESTCLTKLHFHNNLLETAGAIALSPIVENSPKLKDFRFSSLRLGREGTVAICKALKPRLSCTIVHLNLSDNTFGEEGAQALADALSDAPLLETLLLRDAALGDEGSAEVCKALTMGAPNLAELDLSGNEIASQGARGLGKLLALGKLKTVKVEDNEMGSNGAVKIASGIREDALLEVLDVRGSEIGGRGAIALAKAVSRVHCLKELALNGNAIGEEAVSQIEDLVGEALGSLSDNDEDEEEEEPEDDDDDDDDEEEEDQEGLKDDLGAETPVPNGDSVEDPDIDDLTARVQNISM